MNDAQRKIERYRVRAIQWSTQGDADALIDELIAELAALLAQSTPPPREPTPIVKIPVIESELLGRLYAAEEDYTTEWGNGELYGRAADAIRRLMWALHWVAARSGNGLLMAPRDLPLEGFVRDEIALVDAKPEDDAAPDSAAPAIDGASVRRRTAPFTAEEFLAKDDAARVSAARYDELLAAAQADAPEGEPCSQHRTYERHCALCNGATTP